MKHSNLWNDLPDAERKRLMPHMLESQILHIEQCKLKANSAHKSHVRDLDKQISNITAALRKAELNQQGE